MAWEGAKGRWFNTVIKDGGEAGTDWKAILQTEFRGFAHWLHVSREGTGGVQVTLSLLHLGDGVNKALITLRRKAGRRAWSQRMKVLTEGHELAWGRSGSLASAPAHGCLCLPCRPWAPSVVSFCCAILFPNTVSHREWSLCLNVFCWFKCNCCPFLLIYQLLFHFQCHLIKTVNTVSFLKWVCNKRESLHSQFALSMGKIAPNCIPLCSRCLDLISTVAVAMVLKCIYLWWGLLNT